MGGINFDSLPRSFDMRQKQLVDALYKVLEREGVFSDTYDENKNYDMYFKNTRLLLRNYRAIIHSLSFANCEIAEDLNCHSFRELESVLAHYRDFSSFDNKIPEDIAAKLESNLKAVKLINKLRKALSIVKDKPACYNGNIRNKISGETEFQIIYYTYIEMPASYCTSELIKASNETNTSEIYKQHLKDRDMGSRSEEDIALLLGISDRDYRVIRRIAIEDLSAILWGGYTKELSYIIEYLSDIDILEE